VSHSHVLPSSPVLAGRAAGSSSQAHWELVVQERRTWTSLSVAILAAVAGPLHGLTSPLGIVLGIIAVIGTFYCVQAQRAIVRLQRQLGAGIERGESSGTVSCQRGSERELLLG
jgi:hypothetical protein